MTNKFYITVKNAETFNLNKKSKTNCDCGESSCIQFNDENETTIIICDNCSYPEITYTPKEILEIWGHKLDSALGDTCHLYEFADEYYVLRADDSIISIEEDNMYGKEQAIFPY